MDAEKEAEEYFRKVDRRFVEYASHECVDDTLVLAEAASQEARLLWQFLLIGRKPGVDEFPLRVLQALAWLHYARHMAMPSGRDANDLQASAVFFAPIFMAEPNVLPDRMREFFESGPPFFLLRDDEGMPAFLEEAYVQRLYPGAFENAQRANGGIVTS